MTARGSTFHKRPDISVGYGSFHKHRANITRDQLGHEFRYAVQARLAFRRNTLNTDDVERVGLAEISEGIMRRQQHALVRLQLAKNIPRVGIERVQFFHERGCIRGKILLAFW